MNYSNLFIYIYYHSEKPYKYSLTYILYRHKILKTKTKNEKRSLKDDFYRGEVKDMEHYIVHLQHLIYTYMVLNFDGHKI